MALQLGFQLAFLVISVLTYLFQEEVQLFKLIFQLLIFTGTGILFLLGHRYRICAYLIGPFQATGMVLLSFGAEYFYSAQDPEN